MKNLIMDIKHILSGYNFFNDKYLRNIDFARESFTAALKKARQYYDGKSPIKTSPELVHDSWMKNIEALVPYFKFRMNENFLLDEIINGTMVFTDKKVNIKELQNLSSVISAGTIAKIVSGKLNKAFIEGKSKKAAMINSVHHLHICFSLNKQQNNELNSAVILWSSAEVTATWRVLQITWGITVTTILLIFCRCRAFNTFFWPPYLMKKRWHLPIRQQTEQNSFSTPYSDQTQ